MRKNHRLLKLAVAVAAASTGFGAYAEGLEEVIVTAQKRVESLQDTPLAVSAMNEQELRSYGIENLSDLSATVPSLQSYDFPTTSNNVALYMRGMGNPDSQTLTIDNPVGIYIDGVYMARTSGALLDILDLERVEVLRGPQGTLYGRNSTAGAVNFISAKPSEEFGGKLTAGIGNFGAWNVGASLDLPLSDNFRTKVAVMQSSIDGWVENTGANDVQGAASEDFNMKEQSAVRFAAQWTPSDTVTIDYTYDYTDLESTGMFYQGAVRDQTGAIVVPLDQLKRSEDTPYRHVLPTSPAENSGHGLTVSFDLNDNMTLKSITGYREMEERAIQNWGTVLFFATDVDWETEALSQELQLTGTAADGALNYIVGLYYFKEDGKKAETQYAIPFDAMGIPQGIDALLPSLANNSVFVGGSNLGQASFDTEVESKAVFAQATYSVADNFDVTAGVRYTEDERSALRAGGGFNCLNDQTGLPRDTSVSFCSGLNEIDYDNVDWVLVGDWQINDAMSVYARVATGFRAGGSAERAINFTQTFEPETAISYELGFKSELADRRVRLNAAIYQTTLEDYQLTINGPTAQTSALVEVFNVGEATFEGIELDITALLWEGATFSLNYSYLDSELDDLVVPQNSFLLSGAIDGNDRRGQDIADVTFSAVAPETAYTVALDQEFELSNAVVNLHVDYVYRDSQFSSPRGFEVSDLGMFNARASVDGIAIGGDAELSVGLWGKNLTDEEEAVYNLNGLGVQFNTPMTYGLDARITF